MEVWEVAHGLWHWAAPHPEWQPGGEPDSPLDWPEEVGSALAEIGETPVIIDPMVDDDGWEWLDARVAGRSVHVLTTIGFHGRSRGEVLGRYGGDEVAPPGVVGLALPDTETVFWLEPHATLVVGDSIIGAPDGGLRRCPPSWLDTRASDAEQRAALQPLLELPVERVLVSHGESLFSGAGPALRAAIEAPALG
jgi:hypothetical protein